MKRYRVNVVETISGYVEVEAETDDEAAQKAGQMDHDEWEEICIDSTEVPDNPELLSELFDECDKCNEHEDDCVCEYCESCDEPIEDCECDEEEEDEDE